MKKVTEGLEHLSQVAWQIDRGYYEQPLYETQPLLVRPKKASKLVPRPELVEQATPRIKLPAGVKVMAEEPTVEIGGFELTKPLFTRLPGCPGSGKAATTESPKRKPVFVFDECDVLDVDSVFALLGGKGGAS